MKIKFSNLSIQFIGYSFLLGCILSFGIVTQEIVSAGEIYHTVLLLPIGCFFGIIGSLILFGCEINDN